jgi:hypothetical protein
MSIYSYSTLCHHCKLLEFNMVYEILTLAYLDLYFPCKDRM